MPDLWDTNPDHVFDTPDEQANPAPSGHDNDHPNEVMLKDDNGKLRLPAYVLIALVTALATIMPLTAVLLVLPT